MHARELLGKDIHLLGTSRDLLKTVSSDEVLSISIVLNEEEERDCIKVKCKGYESSLYLKDFNIKWFLDFDLANKKLEALLKIVEDRNIKLQEHRDAILRIEQDYNGNYWTEIGKKYEKECDEVEVQDL